MPMPRIVVLISGRGSNLQAILEAELPLQVAGVISNRDTAGGLATAAARGIPTRVVEHRDYPDRTAFDGALRQAIDAFAPDLVVLAGFMRVLTAPFVAHYHRRLLNIHPSLLPAFQGLHTHRRALEAGVRVHGCTVHFVTEQLDHGPIVAQGVVPVLSGDDESSLAARVLALEHQLYPAVLRSWVAGQWDWGADDRIHWQGAQQQGATWRPAVPLESP